MVAEPAPRHRPVMHPLFWAMAHHTAELMTPQTIEKLKQIKGQIEGNFL